MKAIHMRWDPGVLGLLAVIAALLPILSGNPVWLDLGIRTAYYLMLVIGWNLLAGVTGLFSFGHVALAAIGGYASALMHSRTGLPVPLCMIVGTAIAALVGFGVGLASIRVRGAYLIIATFAVLRLTQITLNAEHAITGGSNGIVVGTLFRGPAMLSYYLLGLALVVILIGSIVALKTSYISGYLMAIKDDEEGAQAIGINTRFWKIGVFTYSSAWAGLAGAFMAHYIGFISPGIGSMSEMALVVAMGLIGGLGSLIGAVVSTILLQVVSDQLQSLAAGMSALAFGAVLLGVVLLAPGGLAGLFAKRRSPKPADKTQ